MQQIPNQCVLRYWKVATIRTELVTRRLRTCQAMARHPEDSALPMAAAFGEIKGESAELLNAIQNGHITQNATPWAYQFRDEFDY